MTRARVFLSLSVLLVAAGLALLLTQRTATASSCKANGQQCQTSMSCCSRNCAKPTVKHGSALFGLCCAPGASLSNGTCCTPATSCPAGTCGTISDGCGGTLNCGGCDATQCLTCASNACVSACTSEEVCDQEGNCVTTTTTTSTTTTTMVPTCANGGIPCGSPCGGACGGTCLHPGSDCGGGTPCSTGNVCVDLSTSTGVDCPAAPCTAADSVCVEPSGLSLSLCQNHSDDTGTCRPICPESGEVTTTTSTTTTTLPACQDAAISCHCADGSECNAHTTCGDGAICSDVRFECAHGNLCNGSGGPGDCATVPCTDACTGQPCQ